jgi:hypothetical protein
LKLTFFTDVDKVIKVQSKEMPQTVHAHLYCCTHLLTIKDYKMVSRAGCGSTVMPSIQHCKTLKKQQRIRTSLPQPKNEQLTGTLKPESSRLLQ